MTAQTIRARLLRLEAIGFRISHLPPLRIVQLGALTEEHAELVAAAETEGRFVIIRQIVLAGTINGS